MKWYGQSDSNFNLAFKKVLRSRQDEYFEKKEMKRFNVNLEFECTNIENRV